jgi:lysozyme family protein
MTQSLDSFQTALKFTLKWEGGRGSPQDLGGVIYKGITQATYDSYCRKNGLSLQPISKISDEEVEKLYYEMYWLASHADMMDLPLAVVEFDTAVNFSVRASIEFLQETLGGIAVDGIWGKQTSGALELQNNLGTAKRICQSRIDYRYKRVEANSNQKIFLEGWLKRDNDLLNYVKELGGEIETVSEIEEIEKEERETEEIATEETSEEISPETPEIEGENREEVYEKLERAIGLLQEVIVALKTSK